MASPQKENGYTPIANELMEALAKFRIPGEQMQCLIFILRKTYGFNKSEDMISNSQLVEGTGLDKGNVSRAIRNLVTKHLVIKKDNNRVPTYRFNKNYTHWKLLSKKQPVVKSDNSLLSKVTDTKETTTKERTNKKSTATPTFDKEMLDNASVKKLDDDIAAVCKQLTDKDIFPKVYAWKGKAVKRGYNKRAILHVLLRCVMKREFEEERGAWGYCTKIITVENGNYNEKDHFKSASKSGG